MRRAIFIDDSKDDINRYKSALNDFREQIELQYFDNGVDAYDYISSLTDLDATLIVLDQQFIVKQSPEQDYGIEPKKLFRKSGNDILTYPEDAVFPAVDEEQGFLILEKLQSHFKRTSGSPKIVMCTSDARYGDRADSLEVDHSDKSGLTSSDEIVKFIEKHLSIELKTLEKQLAQLGVQSNCISLFKDCKTLYKRKWKEFVKAVIDNAKESSPLHLDYRDVKNAKKKVESEFSKEYLLPSDYWFLIKRNDSTLTSSVLISHHEDIWFHVFNYSNGQTVNSRLFLLKPEVTKKSFEKAEKVKTLTIGEEGPFLVVDNLVYFIDESQFEGTLSLKYNLNKSRFVLGYEKEKIIRSWEENHDREPLLPLELILCSNIPGKFHFLYHLGMFVDESIFNNSCNSIDRYLLTDVETQLPKIVRDSTYGVGELAGAKWETKAFDAIKEELNLAAIKKYWIIAGHHFVFPKSKDKSNEVDLIIIHPGGIHLCECKSSQTAKYRP